MDASEYYKIRLEHTIQHLQQATRLIYLVSGALVAMLYFVIEKMKDSAPQRYFGIGLLVLLGLVNVIHALLIAVQARWYRAIDEKLAASAGVARVTRGRAWLGSAGLWADLHWLIALAALCAGSYIWWSGSRF